MPRLTIQTLADFTGRLAPFDGWSGTTGVPDLAEAGFDFRLYTLGLSDDAVEGGGVFSKFFGVVVGGHATAMIRRALGTP